MGGEQATTDYTDAETMTRLGQGYGVAGEIRMTNDELMTKRECLTLPCDVFSAKGAVSFGSLGHRPREQRSPCNQALKARFNRAVTPNSRR